MSTYSISSTEYGEYKQIADNIRSDISGYLGIPIYQIHWRDFKNFLEKRFNVTFFPNDSYHGIVAKKISGSITCDGQNTVIEYNNTPDQIAERKHYTIVHEGVHFYCDLKKGKKDTFINDSLDKNLIQPSDYYIEKRAEVTASLIMCSNKELKANLIEGMPFSENCHFFEMSQAAMWYRIKNYLQFDLYIPKHEAKKLVDAYRYGESIERSHFLNLLLANWESFQRIIINQYYFGIPCTLVNNLLYEWNSELTTQSSCYQLIGLIQSLLSEYGETCNNCGATFFNHNFCSLCGTKLNNNPKISNLKRRNHN